MNPRNFIDLTALAFVAAFCQTRSAQAGVFNLPHFVPEGEFAIGLEPEAILGDDSGLGVNAKYTIGLSDQIDGQVILGTGDGPQKFRMGGNLALDLFPDLPKQPGIGLAVHALYYHVREGHETELQLIPYLHKSFRVQGSSRPTEDSPKRGTASQKSAKPVQGKKADTYEANESDESDDTGESTLIDPFVGFPFGYAFSGGRYRPVSTLSVGSSFGLSPHFSAIFEFGMPVNNTQTTVSGGLVYTH